VFDAVQRASARGNDLVLADTAGRLHTKVNLVEELKKIAGRRPTARRGERGPARPRRHTGQNGLVQARQFTEAVDVTGVVLTKLDGTAKGGVVIAIQRELGIPVKLVGLGEGPTTSSPSTPRHSSTPCSTPEPAAAAPRGPHGSGAGPARRPGTARRPVA